jgi:hypothetical protein
MRSSWIRKERLDWIQSVTCPTCGAEPGSRCVTKSGKPVSATFMFHMPRQEEADKRLRGGS